MNLTKAEDILGDWIEEDGSLRDLSPYIRWDEGASFYIILDGQFTEEQLEAMALWIKAHKKQSSQGWCDQFGLELHRDILDPDGWDRKNFSFSFYREYITYDEFVRRYNASTVRLQTDGEKEMEGYATTK